MRGIDEQILAWNPWWSRPETIEADPHLEGFDRSSVKWDPPLLSQLPINFGDAHTLRGPRQAGKTTLAKRVLRNLVRKGESRVLYFSFDLSRTPEAIYDVIRRAKQLHPDPGGPWYLFLDEVTSIPQWQLGVKAAWDQGLIRKDFVLLTGSSAHDLKTGAEQLPGRRGNGADFLHLPMSFRDFCRQVEGIPIPDEESGVEGLLDPSGLALAKRLNLLSADLERAFRAYMRIGGFPTAIKAYSARGAGDPDLSEAVRMMWSTIAGDVAKTDRDQTGAAKLLEEVAISLGSPLKWEGAAKAMGMSAGATAKDYVEFLSESFALLTVFFWDLAGGTLQPGKQRKVYYIDPLLAEVAPSLMAGARRPPADGLAENMVAIALFRSAVHVLTQADAVPGAVGYWRSTNNREIDFVVPADTHGRGGRLPVEVKGDGASGIRFARRAIERAFGDGIVVSRSVFDVSGPIPVLPVHVFLAALADLPRRDVPIV